MPDGLQLYVHGDSVVAFSMSVFDGDRDALGLLRFFGSAFLVIHS